MGDQFYFRGRVDARIRNGVLYVPHAVKAFYQLPRNYLLLEDTTEGFNFLRIYPNEELNRIILPQEALSHKDFKALKKVKWGGMIGLRLPPSSLEHLALEKNSKAKIIGDEFNYNFEVWKPKEFESYESLADLGGVEARLAEGGYNQPTL